jgi:hypothetical protein
MIAAAAQNYGMTSYRIRQPFDFTDRVGTLNVDVNLRGGPLGGWPALALSEDPTPAPNFNFPERGSGPKNGLLIEFFAGVCNDPDTIRPFVYTYADYVETAPTENFDCDVPFLRTSPGVLNHVSVRVGQGQLEIWGANAALPGEAQGAPILLHSQALNLPFSRGYVNLLARNHATIKYWQGAAWLTRWDNVGFDGPVVSDSWEHSAPDPLTESHGSDGCTADGQCIWRGEAIERGLDDATVCSEELRCEFDVTYRDSGSVIPGVDEEPISLTIPNVSLGNATQARLALAVDYPWFSWNDIFPPPTTFNLRYRVNGTEWHDRFVNERELNAFAGDPDEGPGAGLLNQTIDLDLNELHDDDNAVEFALDGAWTGAYRAALTSVDLVLSE